MKTVSRRKFIKGALAGISALSSATIFTPALAQKSDVYLDVDEDGNATLQGAEITVDQNNNATLSKKEWYL